MHVTYLDPSGSQIGKRRASPIQRACSAECLTESSTVDTDRKSWRSWLNTQAYRYGTATNEFHPTQMIADMLTIREHLGRLKGVKFVYMGDARYNMGNSLMVTCAKLGMDFVACTNKKYFPNDELVKYCKDVAETTGASITLTEDVAEGTKDADVIYTDVWVSMGERKRYGQSELTT